MTGLALVDRASDVSQQGEDARVVVLDGAWTPPLVPAAAADGAPITPIRPIVQAVIDEIDVVETSLDIFDRWAAAARLPEAFSVDGVSWWFQARMLLRWDVHEIVLWRLALDRLQAEAPATWLRVPAARPRLVAAARASRGSGRSGAPPAPRIVVAGGGPYRSAASRARVLGGKVLRGVMRWRPATWRRASVLERRLARLASERGGVLALAWPRAYQLVSGPEGDRMADPYLTGALDRVAAAGERVITIGLGMDHARDDDWRLIAATPNLLPERFLAERGGIGATAANVGLVGKRAAASAAPASVIARAATTPAPLGNVDLGPALSRAVAAYGGRWLNRQRHSFGVAASTLELLAPATVFTDREASRTSWLAAARRLGIRTVAVQHGMIYPNSPEYVPGHPTRVRPDTTCVFGEYERDVLVAGAGYAPASVVVTGSPRPIDAGPARQARDRAEVRSELGVQHADRLLLVSVVHNELFGELHTFGALERVLGGPLPGIHLVIKLHPQDDAPPRHEAFLRDLAVAGGYAPPRISVVRDVDLFRYLRAADAHLGQYSTVLSDAVVADTPNMIIVGAARSDTLGYVEAGVAVPVRTIDDLRGFMAAPVPLDAAARAAFLARHFRAGDGASRVAATLIPARVT